MLAENEFLRKQLSLKDSQIETIQSEKVSLESKVSGLETAKSSLEVARTRLENKVSELERQLEWFRRRIFGKMSEKNLPLDPAVLNEPTLFGDLLTDEEKALLAAEADKAQSEITRTITVKPSGRPVRKPLDLRGLEVRETHIYPDGVLDADGNLLPEYTEIGTENSDRLEIIPKQFFVDRTVRHKVALKSHLQVSSPEAKPILIAPLPPKPIERGLAGASVLADCGTRHSFTELWGD